MVDFRRSPSKNRETFFFLASVLVNIPIFKNLKKCSLIKNCKNLIELSATSLQPLTNDTNCANVRIYTVSKKCEK